MKQQEDIKQETKRDWIRGIKQARITTPDFKKTKQEQELLMNEKKNWRELCRKKYGANWTKRIANKLTAKGRLM